MVIARMYFFNAMELVSFKIKDVISLLIKFKPRGAADGKFIKNIKRDSRKGINNDDNKLKRQEMK